jgi:hypothetical protein
MLSVLMIVVGTLAVIAGVIFSLQGFGVLGGSVMSGSSLWAALGPIIAGTGAVAVGLGARRRRRSLPRRG